LISSSGDGGVKNNELFVCHFVGIEDRRLSRIARRILEEDETKEERARE